MDTDKKSDVIKK